MRPQLAAQRPDLSAERVGRVGSSDVGAILGLNPYRSPLDVWQVVTGAHPAPNLDEVLRVRCGQALETVGLEWYERHTGRRAEPVGTVEAPDWPALSATPDGVDVDGGTVVEVKTTFASWAYPPPYYWAQVRYQTVLLVGADVLPFAAAMAGELTMAMVVIRLGSWAPEVEVYNQPYDHALATEQYNEVAAWYQRCVVGGQTPPATAESTKDGSLDRQYPEASGDVEEANAQERALLEEYATWRARADFAKAEADRVRAELCDHIGDRRGIEAEGLGRALWSQRKGAVKIRYKELVESLNLPDTTIEKYTYTTGGGRTFRFTEG